MRARNYRSLERPYTRVEYIAGAPHPRLAKFTYGEFNEAFDTSLKLIAEDNVQIRDVALEAARVSAGKMLTNMISDKNFYLVVKIHPHHVLRENKMIFGAHADRLQEGMSRAFGTPVGRAAQVLSGSVVMEVLTFANYVEQVKMALKTAAKKLPGAYKISIEKRVLQEIN